MLIYIEHTIGYMINEATQKGEKALMKVQKLVESGTIKETSTGYKYLVIEDNENLNDNQDETI
jgi:hypothetical protein